MIRNFHDIERPAATAPARTATAFDQMRDLQSDRAPAFHLPTSPLLGGLIDNANSALARLIEEQTNGFVPFPMKRHRRFYRTASTSLSASYVVPPSLASLTREKPGNHKHRPVSIPYTVLTGLESALAGIGETISWLDWWLSTVSGFSEALHPSAQANFERILSSGSKAISFVGSQAIPALANLLLSRRDLLLAEVRYTVPTEELSLLRHSPLPPAAAIFPSTLLDTALNKARTASNDALVHKALHPARIPKRPAQGSGRSNSTNRSADTSGRSLLTPVNSSHCAQTAKRTLRLRTGTTGTATIAAPFPDPPAVPAIPVARAKGPENIQTDSHAPSGRVGGCLAHHWRQWSAIGADPWVVSVLRDGYRIPLADLPPPLATSPARFPTYRPGSEQAHSLLMEIDTMVTKGVLEIVPDPDPGFYSRLFLVEKASGGWRPVIDLSPLNEFVQQTPFKMETPNSVLLTVRKNDFLASIDLRNAYFQILVHPSSRKLLRFVSNDTVYQFKAICFGLSTAPQVFTRVFAAVSSWAHARGIRLLQYLDDWLIFSASQSKTRQHVDQLLSLCRSLGIVINTEKSDLSSSRSVEYLGMVIDTVSAQAFPTEARVEKFLSLARKFLAQPNPPVRQWQVLLGHMSSLEKLVPRARLRMRSLQWQLKSVWSTETDPLHLPVPRSRQVDTDVSWWMSRDHLLQGGALRGAPPPNSTCTRTHLGRGGEPTSSIVQRRDYGQARRPHSTSTSWR